MFVFKRVSSITVTITNEDNFEQLLVTFHDKCSVKGGSFLFLMISKMENELQPANTTVSRNFQCKTAPRWLSIFFFILVLRRERNIKTTSLNSFGFKNTKVVILQVLHKVVRSCILEQASIMVYNKHR